MINDSLLRLKLAFSNIPMKGLFFWEGLLFLEDDQYKKTVEENLVNTINEDIANEAKDRQGIMQDPKIRSSVETIRDALIAEAANEIIINDMQANLAKQEPEQKN